jgi:hypothetical protein
MEPSQQCPQEQPIVPLLCAWCLKEQGLLTPEHQHPTDSHGICPSHAQAEYERLRASRMKPQ